MEGREGTKNGEEECVLFNLLALKRRTGGRDGEREGGWGSVRGARE